MRDDNGQWQQEQDERENLSGADLAEAYEYEQLHEKNRHLLNGFKELHHVYGEFKSTNFSIKENEND